MRKFRCEECGEEQETELVGEDVFFECTHGDKMDEVKK